MARSFSSDSKELAGLPGEVIFFSFNFETAIGSKPKKTSLCRDTFHTLVKRLFEIPVSIWCITHRQIIKAVEMHYLPTVPRIKNIPK